jgi:hypothetical protein
LFSAQQLEEPFTILPMQIFCDKIYNWCNEIVSFDAGDNGMAVNSMRPEHTVAFLGGEQKSYTMQPQPVATSIPDPIVNGYTNGANGETEKVNGGALGGIARFLKG